MAKRFVGNLTERREMNLYWTLKPGLGKRDKNQGAILMQRNNARYPRKDIFECMFPLNRWGAGYWRNR